MTFTALLLNVHNIKSIAFPTQFETISDLQSSQTLCQRFLLFILFETISDLQSSQTKDGQADDQNSLRLFLIYKALKHT